MKTVMYYGSFESHPARFSDAEAWVLIAKNWCQLGVLEVWSGVEEMTRADFEKTYGPRPPLPGHVFAS
jgi:hypothetical protein